MLLQAQAVELKAKLFRGFSDSSRLAIMDVLREGPLTVTQIVEATGLTQSNTSNHLSCLKDCGLVVCQNQGRSMIYRLGDERVAQLLDLADTLLLEVTKGVYDCARYCEDK